MAGHNKWSKVKRKKGVLDAKRGKIFSRIIKEISVAVKEGKSGEPEFNPRLRMAISNAKGANMPKENMERAIKKALDSSSESLLETNYEGYAPGGVAVFVECTTDNLNRTISNVRSTFNKYAGSLATSGSVDFLFDRKGIFILDSTLVSLEDIELDLIDGGAEDIEFDSEENQIVITVAFEDFGNMQKKLESLSIDSKSASLEREPLNTVSLDIHDSMKAMRLIETLEEDDDVNQVFHNLEMTDEIMERLQE